MVHRIARIAEAPVRNSALAVVKPAHQRHIALIGDGVFQRSRMVFINPNIDTLSANARHPVRLKRGIGVHTLVQLAIVHKLVPGCRRHAALFRQLRPHGIDTLNLQGIRIIKALRGLLKKGLYLLRRF